MRDRYIPKFEINMDDSMKLKTGSGEATAEISRGDIRLSFEKNKTTFNIDGGSNGLAEKLSQLKVADGSVEARMTDLETPVELELSLSGGELRLVCHERTGLIRKIHELSETRPILDGFRKVGEEISDGHVYELIVSETMPEELPDDWFVNRVIIDHADGELAITLSPPEEPPQQGTFIFNL